MIKFCWALFLLFLLAIAAFTAASEIAIIAVSRIKLKRLAGGGSKTAKIIIKILETPERFFGTLLVVSSIVSALIASMITVAMVAILGGEAGVVASTIFVSVVIIVFEVVAKTIAATNSEKVALLSARPVSILIKIFSPVVNVLGKATNIVTRLITGHKPAKNSLISEEEIRALIKVSGEEGVLHGEKLKMLTNVFDFSDALVNSVMRPRADIVAVNIKMPIDEIINRAIESGYSRLPVYSGTLDQIVGVLNMKDLLLLMADKDLIVLQDIVYPATVVRDTKRVADLLKEFQKGHTHLAVVTDSSNNICGIITLEDLLEEIVGEIEDEHDVRPVGVKNGGKIQGLK